MKKEIIVKLTKKFEEAARVEQGVEYWMVRDIQDLLEYDKWDNFLNVVEKAKVACQNSSQIISDHFAEGIKLIGKVLKRSEGLCAWLRPSSKV